MGLMMKNLFLGFTKNQYRGGIAQKGAWTVCRFKGGLGKKEGGGVFEGGLTPQCTLWGRSKNWYFFVDVINGQPLK